MFDWTFTDKGDKLLAAWATESYKLLSNEDVILTLWFAKKDGVQPGDRVEIEFTVNTLGNVSELSVLFAGQMTAIEAETVDGSITFELILYGDANCDGSVTSADAAIILRSLIGLSELIPRGVLNGDVNGDFEITAEDAAIILRYVVGLIDTVPTEYP